MIKCNWTNFSLRKLIGALTPNSLKHQMTDNLGLVDGSNYHFIKWQPRLVVRNRTLYISRARKKIHVREIEQFFLFRSFWLSASQALKILRHRALRVYEGEDNFYRRSEEKKIKLKKKKSSWNVIWESREWLDFATQVKMRWMQPRSVQVSWLTNILAWLMELSVL